MVKPLPAMLKKNMSFSWTQEGKTSFEKIKEAIASAPTLINPSFDKDFILYTLGGESNISAVLTQLNSEGTEQPIAFFSEVLKDYENN